MLLLRPPSRQRIIQTSFDCLCIDIYNGLLLINGFDRALFDKALKRFNVEPQCPTNLDGREFAKP
jgi:hypothetical protein